MDIKEALGQLDTMEDEHWTSDGLPKTDVVSAIMESKVSRKDITDAAPKFTRENTDLTLATDPEPDPPEEEAKADEPPDAGPLKDFAEMAPMLPQELADKVLSKIDPRLLPEVELMLAQQIQVVEEREKEVEEMKRKLKLGKALTQTWIKQLVPDMSNQEAIQAYIRSSTEQRQAKAESIREVLGGLKPADIAKLDPRAAIDKAFARKTGRGGQRPVR